MELNRSAEFVNMARLAMLGKGSSGQSARLAEEDPKTSSRVARVLKAAVTYGSLDDPAWAGSLSDMREVSDGFIESLRNLSAFDRLLDSGMRRIPLDSRTTIVTASANGSIVPEGQITPVTSMAIGGAGLAPKKAVALVAVSDELLRVSEGGQDLLSSELRQAVAVATDQSFLAGIAAGATEIASSGDTPAAVLQDLRALFAAVQPKASSRLFFVTDSLTAANLATKANADGSQAFPDMTAQGGLLAGTPLLVADGLPTDAEGSTLMLIEATAVAGDTDIVTIDVSQNAVMQLNTAPVSTAAAVNVSLWQSNLVGLRATRWFGFNLARANGVALLTGVQY